MQVYSVGRVGTRVSSEKEKSFREIENAKILRKKLQNATKNVRIFLRNISFAGNPSLHGPKSYFI